MGQAWWHTTVIPGTWKVKTVGFRKVSETLSQKQAWHDGAYL
jgi:hypothetical protein